MTNTCRTPSIFYHRFYVREHKKSTNLIIFRLCLNFIKFYNYSVLRSRELFVNTIFEMTMSTMTWGLTVHSETRISFFQEFSSIIFYFMYLQFKIWLIRKIHLTDSQFLYIANITIKKPNFNTEYQAMFLQCRKSFEFENSKFSNCLPCA